MYDRWKYLINFVYLYLVYLLGFAEAEYGFAEPENREDVLGKDAEQNLASLSMETWIEFNNVFGNLVFRLRRGRETKRSVENLRLRGGRIRGRPCWSREKGGRY